MLRVEANLAFDYVKRFRLGPSSKDIKKAGTQYEVHVPLITAHLQSTLEPVNQAFVQLCESPPNRTLLRPVFFNEQCENCLSHNIRNDTHRGVRLCIDCGFHLDDNLGDESSYLESYGPMRFIGNGRTLITFPRRMRDDMYKRINHFRSWLLRIQGKELCEISSAELDQITNTCIRYNFNPPTYHDVRAVLRICGLQKWNTHVYSILMHMTGVQQISLTDEQHAYFIKEFMRLQLPFYELQHVHERLNFPSYAFTLYKLSLEAGWHNLAYALPMTRSDPNRVILERVWKIIIDSRDASVDHSNTVRKVDADGMNLRNVQRNCIYGPHLAESHEHLDVKCGAVVHHDRDWICEEWSKSGCKLPHGMIGSKRKRRRMEGGQLVDRRQVPACHPKISRVQTNKRSMNVPFEVLHWHHDRRDRRCRTNKPRACYSDGKFVRTLPRSFLHSELHIVHLTTSPECLV